MWPRLAMMLEEKFGPMVARFVASKAGRVIAGEVEKAGGAKMLSKSYATIYKRIGARNLRKAALSGSFNSLDALRGTTSTTNWIVKRIATAEYLKSYRTLAINRFATTRNAKLAFDARRAISKEKYSNLLTNAIANQSYGKGLSTAAQYLLKPQTKKQQYVQGFAKGVFNQSAATAVFNLISVYPEIGGAAWSTQFVQNLDELYLPVGSANSKFAKVEMAVRAFDVASIKKGQSGSYSRILRPELYRGAKAIPSHPNGTLAGVGNYLGNVFTPQGLGRLTGAFATRQILLATGQDERQQRTYAKAATRNKTYVSGYTRSDGSSVNGYWRDK